MDNEQNVIAINMVEIGAGESGGLPGWVMLLPAGMVMGRDGREWNNSRPQAIVDHFAGLGRDLPIDVEHASELQARQGNPAPAIGWVKELQSRAGAIWGRVEWNQSGKKLIEGREYRYLSPVILYQQETGTIVGLTSVGATNQPNLRLPALNQQRGQAPKEHAMLKALLAELALPETATEAEAVVRLKEIKGNLASATNRADNPSLEKFVPRADHDAALARASNAEQALADIRKEQLETAINAEIETALKAGKITPATADYHRAQCRQEGGLERFKAYCAAAPEVGGGSGLAGKKPEGEQQALNSEQAEIARMFGNTPADLEKFGK